jgi:hypothetical protein
MLRKLLGSNRLMRVVLGPNRMLQMLLGPKRMMRMILGTGREGSTGYWKNYKIRNFVVCGLILAKYF